MTTPSPATGASASKGASRWTIAVFTLLGLGVGLLVFALRSPTYESQALVAVSNPAGPLANELAVVTSPTVINAATNTLGFEPNVTVTAAEVASLLTIVASADDAQRAADAANTVAATYVQAQLGAAANVAQPAVAPTDPSGLGVEVFALVGSLLGALIGGLVSYFQSFGRKEEAAPLAPTLPDPGLVPDNALDVRLPTVDQAVPKRSSNSSPFANAAALVNHDDTSLNLGRIDETDPVVVAPVQHVAEVEPVEQPNAVDMVTSSDPEPEHDDVPDPSVKWPSDASPFSELADLDRRSLMTQFETARYELMLNHNEQLARKDADHERQMSQLRAEAANLTKQVRMQEVRLKNRTGTDQTRVGDLEAQTDALEIELADLRRTLENERIAHTKRITEERGTADRALDNARRQYREELAKHVHTHRQALADHRVELDNELAGDRAHQATSLEAQHIEYERQLENERNRLESQLNAAIERHDRELGDLHTTHRQEIDRQAEQHKETIAALRETTENSDEQLRELEKGNRALRVELTTQQKQSRHNETEHAALIQRLSDEISIMRGELEGERERNTALRADVLRRSAEAHQAIDRAVEERTAQLAELESSVARQREYADRRVRETSAAAEEQARQAAMREADLTATISRLKREVAEAKQAR